MTNLLLLICLTFICASESNSIGSIENGDVEKGQTLDRPIPPHQGQNEIATELEKLHSDIGPDSTLLRDSTASNPIENAVGNPFSGMQQGKVPNPLSGIDSQKFKNDPLNVKEANPFPAIQRGKIPNPLSEIGSQKFNNGPVNVKEANPLPGIQKETVSNFISESNVLDDGRLTREVMDIYEDFVSHQSSIGDEKHTNSAMNAKDANQIAETVAGGHFLGVVPQNSRNPLKRSGSSEWGEFLQDLEDSRKIHSKIVPPNSLQVEKAPKKRRNQKVQLAKPMSVEDEAMKNVLDNYQDQDQFKYNWKNWDKKASDYLSGVVPVNSRKNPKRTASKDWGQILQMIEAEHEAKHSTVDPPNVRNVLEGHTILRPVPNRRIIKTPTGIFNIIL